MDDKINDNQDGSSVNIGPEGGEKSKFLNKKLEKRRVIKTYRDFAIEALKDKPTSLAKMIIREKKKREYEHENSPKSKKNIIIISLSSILFILGIIAVASVVILSFKNSEKNINDEVKIEPKSIIYFDYKIENDITGASRSDIKNILKNDTEEAKIPIGDSKIFYFITKDDKDVKKLTTAAEFLEVLDTRAPAQFIRNMKEEFSVGIFSTSDKIAPFLVLGTNNFDASYGFLLEWEKTLMSDLAEVLGVSYENNSQKFQDLNIYNKDTKVILDREGKIVFGYSFVDLKTLVFFSSASSFKKITNSLQNNKKRK